MRWLDDVGWYFGCGFFSEEKIFNNGEGRRSFMFGFSMGLGQLRRSFVMMILQKNQTN